MLVRMSPPSLDVAREILTSDLARMRSMAGFNSSRSVEIAAAIGVVLARLALDGAEIAACSAAAGGDRGSDERLSEYIARLRRTAYSVPVHDSDGRKIGEGRVDGATFVARITDEHAAAMIRASNAPRGISVGYRVKVEPEPARPALAIGMRVRTTPQPIPGLVTPWAGLVGSIVDFPAAGNVRVAFEDGRSVTCGPDDVTPQPAPSSDVRPPAGTHEPECAIHIPGADCSCPAGWPIAEPAPGAPRVLCGLPVDGANGACSLRYGHIQLCEVEPVRGGIDPAPGTVVRVTAGDSRGLTGVAMERVASDPSGWIRVRRPSGDAWLCDSRHLECVP